jgi:hypothetical protein
MKLFVKENKTDGLYPLGLYGQNKTSCLTTAFLEIFACECVLGRVSCLVVSSIYMSGRTIRKCKETLLQVKQRLIREQERE